MMRSQSRWPLAAAAIAVVAIVVAAVATTLYRAAQPPDDNSADAGFARDMATHHAQAVAMGLIVVARTDDDAFRTMAGDIMLTQQAQIGIMQGWLDAWDLPQAGAEPPMTWMIGADTTMPGDKTGGNGQMADAHVMGDEMPGWATAEEIDALKTLPVPEMEIHFLRLLILHHQGGVLMAEAALDRADTDQVRRLARSIVVSQQSEITLMQQMLADRGAA